MEGFESGDKWNVDQSELENSEDIRFIILIDLIQF